MAKIFVRSTVPVATEAAMSLPYVSGNFIVIFVYVLYFLGYSTGISALIGVIIAHMKVNDETDPVVRSHYLFQIRTFWIGLLYLGISIPLCLVLIGVPLFVWWIVWSLIRIVKGSLFIAEHRPIVNPRSWLFGG
jgi:uncharacterized membrane protein